MSYNHNPIFMPGDKVHYAGERLRNVLTKDGKPVDGWVHARVHNQKETFVVEFPDLKEPDYILSAEVLVKAPVFKNLSGPEVSFHRRKLEETD